jgi:hypothetical protein
MMTGFIVIFLFAYSSLFPKMQEEFEKNYYNVDITFFDQSIQRLDPSGKVKINGRVVYQIDSISKSLYQDNEVNLKKGKHIVEISTIDDKYKVIDTVEVVKYPMKYKLWIRFQYNPPVDEYKQVVIDDSYMRITKEKDYTTNQKEKVLELLTEKINQEFEGELTYKQTDPYFTYTFRDITYYPIE